MSEEKKTLKEEPFSEKASPKTEENAVEKYAGMLDKYINEDFVPLTLAREALKASITAYKTMEKAYLQEVKRRDSVVAEIQKPELTHKGYLDILIGGELRLQPPLGCMNSDFRFGFERGFQIGEKFGRDNILARLGVKEKKETITDG